MQDPLRAGLVDQLHERDVLGCDSVGVTGVDGQLEPPEIGLDDDRYAGSRAAVAGDEDPLRCCWMFATGQRYHRGSVSPHR